MLFIKANLTMSENQLNYLTASEIIRKIKLKEVSPLEVLDAAVLRIEEVNPRVNALPILCIDQARDRAKKLTQAMVSGDNC